MRLRRRLCKICRKKKTQNTWDLKQVCRLCYIKTRLKKLNFTCIHCNSKKTQGNWYIGPTCSNCYRKKDYWKFKKKHQKRLYKNNRSIKSRFNRGKKSCGYRGLKWNIKLKDYEKLINSNCYYCGFDTKLQAGINLDRLNNNKGYMLNNVVPCCKNCNFIKNSILTCKEMICVVKLIKRIRNTTNSPWEVSHR